MLTYHNFGPAIFFLIVTRNWSWLQRQIEAVRTACDVAEKVITEARKVYGLGTRQGPLPLPTPDKLHITRINEQEKILRTAIGYGEGRSIYLFRE